MPMFYSPTVAQILSGTIDGAVIGGNNPAAGSFTSLNVPNNGTGSAISATTNASTNTVQVTDTGANGANLKFVGNGVTTPAKYIRVNLGTLQIVNSAYSAVIASLTDSGSFSTGAINSTPVGSTTPSTGAFTAVSAASETINSTQGSGGALVITDATANAGANIKLTGDGATTPTKYIRATGGPTSIFK